jgi:hypothetical protein
MKDSWRRALEEEHFRMEAGVLEVLAGVEKVAGAGVE